MCDSTTTVRQAIGAQHDDAEDAVAQAVRWATADGFEVYDND